ncbi:MAG: hypothetical protein ACN6O8_16470 [Achromobacter sp.]|uniref:hypothetical protein n=1 Tax=Achromobacter sp. TaxID=134375 RepID=UPI003D037FF2
MQRWTSPAARCSTRGGPSAALEPGLENLARKDMQGRGLLLNLARHYGTCLFKLGLPHAIGSPVTPIATA